MLKGLEKGVDLASEHIPDIAIQYVVFEAVIAWLWVLLGLFLILFFIPRMIKRLRDLGYEGGDPEIVFSYVSYLVPIACILFSIATAIKTTFFPKLFLISEFISTWK